MTLSWILMIFLLGIIGSMISGMLGIGGAIIKFPMLLFIPPLFGFTAFTAHEVSGISAVEVMFASLAGVLAYRKSNLLYKPLIVTMGSGVVLGSLVGSFASSLFDESAVNIVYGILAMIAAVMMFIKREEIAQSTTIHFNKILAFSLAVIVGLASGIVGAGGGFILVPIMLVVLRIPTRVTIASSLAITFFASIGGSIGKISTGQVPWLPTIIMIIASLIAAPIGAKLSKKMNSKILRILLAVLIIFTAIKIWYDLLF
ncbi:sulfite exporter TauE/SafE family protein [Kurthia sibirica]|uniref:Probable membrane transporter protein n=1 Tax=Kurthia sibirica TaxID=202750 RepID=A0A2U3ANA2_9BACL|nr:sulfite exporter TauE/SafE family protein [Kurthia sibirica]PWI25995.1 hypothetical protein DEX24_05545 [Kurthia sibirica]GEK35287.1 UPF0721 transmembrane protein [Kurthia sibirica]